MRPQNTADVARTLQEGLAPKDLPEIEGLATMGRYRAGGVGEVGGDWYDVLELPDNGVAVVVGDVAGRGVDAATTMGQMRHGSRAYLLDEHSPAAVLDRLNRLIAWLLPGEVASAVVAVFDRDSEAVAIASAGHLPPLLITGAGEAEYLAVPSGPALGLTSRATYADWPTTVAGETLLLFTDGLVERRGESIDDGLQRLVESAQRHPLGDDFLDALIAEVPHAEGEDDLAVLAVRRSPPSDGDRIAPA